MIQLSLCAENDEPASAAGVISDCTTHDSLHHIPTSNNQVDKNKSNPPLKNTTRYRKNGQQPKSTEHQELTVEFLTRELSACQARIIELDTIIDDKEK